MNTINFPLKCMMVVAGVVVVVFIANDVVAALEVQLVDQQQVAPAASAADACSFLSSYLRRIQHCEFQEADTPKSNVRTSAT
jgi:hypothetical protein